MFEDSIVTEKDNKLSPKEFILKYIIYLPLIIFCLLVSLLIGYFYLRYKVPQYSSNISILIKETSVGSSDAILEELGMPGNNSNLANEAVILKSTPLMQRVVDSLNLNTLYFFNGKVKTSELYGGKNFVFTPIIFKDSSTVSSFSIHFNKEGEFQVNGKGKWIKNGEVFNFNSGSGRIDYISNGSFNTEYSYTIKWMPSRIMAKNLSNSLFVNSSGRTINRDVASVLDLTILTEVPKKGTEILNKLSELYSLSEIETKNRIVDNTVRFVDNRLELLSEELGDVEKGLESFRESAELIDAEAQGSAQFSEIKEIQAKLNDEEVRLRVIKMLRDYINDPPNKFNLVPSSLGIDDPTLISLISEYNGLQLQREEKLKVMPAGNTIIVVLESQIERLRLSILENLRNIQAASSSLKNKIESQLNKSRASLLSMPSKQRRLLEIMRQQGIKQQLFLLLLQKREESAITRASAVSESYAVEPAESNLVPVDPKKGKVYGIAIVLGLLIPGLIIYLKQLLNDTLTTRNDITREYDIPIIGEISHFKLKERELIVSTNDRSAISEQFRVVRTNLEFLLRKEKTPTLLVTSSVPGEGKSFTCINVGAVWAATKKKTVIVELDLRKPKISKEFGIKTKKGISDFIIGKAAPEELPIKVIGVENLYVVSCGTIPPNPSELLVDEKMAELIDYLKDNFDVVILDSAPIGLVSDAKTLSRFADVTLYLIRQQYSKKKSLEFINNLRKRNELPNLQLIVNDVKSAGLNSYYGYGNGYGYGYGYGYGENVQIETESNNSVWQRIKSKIGIQ